MCRTGHIKKYTYDEFGNKKTTEYDENGNPVLNPNNEVFKNEVTFTGSITDMSTGLQYMNARYYDSTNGRFLSQDTYSGNPYEPWTQHLYSYCGNNPTNFVDPTGHRPIMGDDPSVERWTRKNGEWVYLGLTERGKKNEKRKQESGNIEKPPVLTQDTPTVQPVPNLESNNGSGNSTPLVNNMNQEKGWTICLGTEWYAQFCARVSKTDQLFYSSDGTYGIIKTAGIGGGLVPGIGVNLKFSQYDRPSSQLQGRSVSVGGSGGTGLIVGGEVIFDDKGYAGWSATAGVGVSMLPFDMNTEANFTYVEVWGRTTPKQAQNQILMMAINPSELRYYPIEVQRSYETARSQYLN